MAQTTEIIFENVWRKDISSGRRNTPVEKLEKRNNVVSCDLFSTDRCGNNIGKCEFTIVDTLSWGIKAVKD